MTLNRKIIALLSLKREVLQEREELQIENPELLCELLHQIIRNTADGITDCSEIRKTIEEKCRVKVGPIAMNGQAIVYDLNDNTKSADIYFGALRYEEYDHDQNSVGTYNAGATFRQKNKLF